MNRIGDFKDFTFQCKCGQAEMPVIVKFEELER